MQRGQKIKAKDLEGLILCQTEELGLYPVSHWESLTDFKQGLKRSAVQFGWSILPIMWHMDLKGAKLQARGLGKLL